MTAEDKADRYRVLDEPIRLTALADRVRTAVEEFDQLIGVNTPDEQSQLRKWIKRCKVKTAANTTKQQFTNAGLLVLMRQHYETVQGSDISYMPSGSSYLDTATAPVSNSLTSHFNTILGEMYQSPLDVYKRHCRVPVPVHRRPDINYLSERPQLKQIPISKMANSNAFVTIITVTLFNPEKQHARSEEVEILSSQTVADLLSHIGCHTPARTAESEQILTGVCCIGDNVYVDVTDKPSVEYGQRLSRSLKEDPYTFIVPTTAVLATKFEDIDIVLGQQNLLSHGGHCRHAFMFKNVRCVQLAQAKDKSLFPRTIFRGRINRVKCHMCTIYPAERVILDDVHCGDTPVMLCICCYSMFLEDADGKLLREVKEVPYNTKQMEFDEACDEAGGM